MQLSLSLTWALLFWQDHLWECPYAIEIGIFARFTLTQLNHAFLQWSWDMKQVQFSCRWEFRPSSHMKDLSSCLINFLASTTTWNWREAWWLHMGTLGPWTRFLIATRIMCSCRRAMWRRWVLGLEEWRPMMKSGWKWRNSLKQYWISKEPWINTFDALALMRSVYLLYCISASTSACPCLFGGVVLVVCSRVL